MKTVGVIVALVVALALQTTLAGLRIGGTTAVNLVLVVVIYVGAGVRAGGRAARRHASAGWSRMRWPAGSSASAGFRRRWSGFLVGVLGAQFIVSQPLPRFVMFVGGDVRARGCASRRCTRWSNRAAFRLPYSATLTQALVNGVVGMLAFQVVEQGPQMLQRRRGARREASARRQLLSR